MKRNPFTFLRIFTCIALLALLGERILTNGPTINLLLFLLLVLFWFVPTLMLNAAHAKTPRSRMLSNTLCAVLDSYVLMIAAAEAAADLWTKPFLLLGVYVFMASLLGGALAGVCSALAGFCGLLNAWLIPQGELQPAFLLGGVFTSVAGFVCGSFWRLLLPLVVRAAKAQEAPSAPATTAQTKNTILAGMESRLLEITAERDHAQERLSQLEAQPTDAAAPSPAEKPAHMEPAPQAEPSAPAEELLTPQAYLQQREAELASLQAEIAALDTEKQKLLSENSRLSDELMAAFLPPP